MMTTKTLVLALGSALFLSSTLTMAADPAAGKAKFATCAGCHGANGVATAPTFPTLAGRDAAYVKEALNAYKSGARNNATMKAMASSLSDADIDNVAAYVATLAKP
jgi:cytochrome c553